MHQLANILILLIIVFAVIAVAWWFLKKATVPEPFNYILYAVIAIICIVLLLKLPGLLEGGNLQLGW